MKAQICHAICVQVYEGLSDGERLLFLQAYSGEFELMNKSCGEANIQYKIGMYFITTEIIQRWNGLLVGSSKFPATGGIQAQLKL